MQTFSAEYFLEMVPDLIDGDATKEQCDIVNEIAEFFINNPDAESPPKEYNFVDVEMEFIVETLNETIVHDNTAKQLTYLTMLLNYTEEDATTVDGRLLPRTAAGHARRGTGGLREAGLLLGRCGSNRPLHEARRPTRQHSRAVSASSGRYGSEYSRF